MLLLPGIDPRYWGGPQERPDAIVGSHYACHLHGVGRSNVKSAMLYVGRAGVAADGLPVCDILQCYLDVGGSRARGQEQADYIAEKILLPHFRSMP
jgi:hypothetical protein